jgi:hypothetical protein
MTRMMIIVIREICMSHLVYYLVCLFFFIFFIYLPHEKGVFGV